MSMDAIRMDGRRITQADADRIAKSHIMRSQGSETSEPNALEQDLRHRTLQLAELAAGAASGSREFGDDLTDQFRRLSGGAASIEQIVEAMIDRTRGVEAQLTAASEKIERLRSEVEAVRGDALRDALTGLLNRRGLTEELRNRSIRKFATLAMCDVDRFKSINDQHGHAVGDRVLKGVAASLSESLGVHHIARWGGEEFVVILEGIDINGATRLLNRARTDLAGRTFKLHDTGIPLGQVTISIGATPLQGAEPEAAIEAADRLLYKAKAEGRNRVVV
jgi:diguanylate cyclase